MVRTKWYGHNGTDKMVWTKWYGQYVMWTKWYWTKWQRTNWYRQNGMDKMLHWQNGTDKLVRTNGYGQKGTDKMLCWQNVTKQWSVHKKIWDKLKRLIHRKVTLNKLKSIIVKRNCDLFSMITTIELALPSIYLVNKPHSGFELGRPESKS